MSLAARRLDEDACGVGAARTALEELALAGRLLGEVAAAGSGRRIIAEAALRVTEAVVVVETIIPRQIASGLVYDAGYAAGLAAGLAARRLHSV